MRVVLARIGRLFLVLFCMAEIAGTSLRYFSLQHLYKWVIVLLSIMLRFLFSNVSLCLQTTPKTVLMPFQRGPSG